MPWWRLRGLLSSGFCVNIFDHISFRLLSAVHVEDNWWWNNYFWVALVWRIALLYCHLNRPWMTFVRNFTAIASAITLTVCAAMVFLSYGGVHRIANRFYSAWLHCLLRVSELWWILLTLAFLSFNPIFRVLFWHRFLNQSERANFRNRYMIDLLLSAWDALWLEADWILFTLTTHAMTRGEGNLGNRRDFAHGLLVRSTINMLYSVTSCAVFLGIDLSLNKAWSARRGRVHKTLIFVENRCSLFSARSRGISS